MVIFNFIFDNDVGMFSRVKRSPKTSISGTPRALGTPVVEKNESDLIDVVSDEKLVSRAYADSDSARLD